LPRPLADAVACVHRRLTVGRLGREVGAPGLRARAGRLRQRLAMIVGASEPAEIAAIADAVTGQKEGGVGGLRLCRCACESRHGGKRQKYRRDGPGEAVHRSPPFCFWTLSSTHRGSHYSRNKADHLAMKKAPRS